MKTVHTLLTLIMIFASSYEVFAEENYKVTAASILNVRNNPTTKSKIVGTLRSGQQIEVLNISEGWAKLYTMAEHAILVLNILRRYLLQ